MMDAAEEWGITVRVVDVVSLGGERKVPLFSLIYKVIDRAGGYLHDRVQELFGTQRVYSISTTELERKMMLKLFAQNGKRISSEYKPVRGSTEGSFRPTFLLPLGPLNMRDLGKLNNTPGCEVCGKVGTSRCTQCFTVSYCGKECQRADWSSHKPTCRSLKGGTWHTVTFERDPIKVPGGQYMAKLVLNRFDSMHDATSRIESGPTDGPPPNIHGDKAFLVKFQVALSQYGDDSSMLLYDRQRSFQVHWMKRDDRAAYVTGEVAMADGLKMYRWARRAGDHQLSVCFDRPPEKNPVW